MAGESGDAAVSGSSADARARAVEEQMTDDERFSLLVSVMGVNDVVTVRDERIRQGVPMSAGYVPGVPRLGIPPLLMSDASLGVTNPGYRPGDTATALPAGIALGASFNPELARQSDGMLGREARTRGFNVQLASASFRFMRRCRWCSLAAGGGPGTSRGHAQPNRASGPPIVQRAPAVLA